MNTNAIRDVATKARRQLIEAVERRCLLYGIQAGSQRDAETVNGHVLSAAERAQRRELLRIQDDLRGDGKPDTGHAALVEQAAYIWFNRLFAIRFMELNDRLPSHVRMLSAQDGSFAPECLREAMDLPLDALDRTEAARLVAKGDDEGLFRLILLAQCAELAECLPAVFERVGSAMELLLPDGLLSKDGVVESLVTGIPEEDWREGVEIVGWAYQFYVSERKDEFFKSKRKAGKDDIAPATQLFTPEYIVRFLVQNSLGRLWVLNNLSSPLAGEMEYFVEPDPEDHEVFRKVASPEEISLIDPACGSGHFLCYAFDLLARMYEERGYRRRDIPQLILERNLTGVEIDCRAASLTSFALTMKALEWDARFLRRGVAPKVVCIESVDLTREELEIVGAGPEQQALVDLLAHLGEVGSLWQPTSEDVETLAKWHERAMRGGIIFAGTAAKKLARAQEYAQTLASACDICATNPPYMGSGSFSPWLNEWTRREYADERYDLCTCFITRSLQMLHNHGFSSLVTMQTWMTIRSYEKLRCKLLDTASIVAMAHLGTRAFDAISGEVVSTASTVFEAGVSGESGAFIDVTNIATELGKSRRIIEAVNDSTDCLYRANNSMFRALPGCRIVYWVSSSMYDAFSSMPRVDAFGKTAAGLMTGDNAIFLRLWWELSSSQVCYVMTDEKQLTNIDETWFPCNKGGSYRKWYGNYDHVIRWVNGGQEIADNAASKGRHWQDYDSSLKFRPCITWSDISSDNPSFRFYNHALAEHTGMCFYPDEKMIPFYLSLLNSTVAKRFLRALAPTIHLNVGELGVMPACIQFEHEAIALGRKCIDVCRRDWDSFETSWDFTVHPLIRGNLISSAYGLWSAECKDRFDTLKSSEEQLNAIFARIYNMEGEVPIEVEDDKVSVRRPDLGRDVRSLISYAVGCMFGRYSLDKPGLLLANQGDRLNEYLAQVPHPRYMPDDDGILPITDDEYFEDDIVAMFCEFLKAAYGPETLEENLRFVADALSGTGPARKVIRNYFMNQFFADHCATYSVPSAGKRPIYWLVDSGRLGGFRALVYMHRYTPDLLARVRTDYVHERQERYRSRISELEREREAASRREQSAIDRELKRLRAQLDEVTKFEERLHHLADQMIGIDLDDGFKVNYAKFADVMAKVK